MANAEVTTGEIMDFLRENMVTRDEVESIVGKKVQASAEMVLTSVDRFVKLHETLDQELVAMRSKYSRLEDRLEIVERKLGLAT